MSSLDPFFDQIYIFSNISIFTRLIHVWQYRFVLNKIDYLKARSLERHSSNWRLRPFSRFHFNQKTTSRLILHSRATFMKNHKHGLNELVKLAYRLARDYSTSCPRKIMKFNEITLPCVPEIPDHLYNRCYTAILSKVNESFWNYEIFRVIYNPRSSRSLLEIEIEKSPSDLTNTFESNYSDYSNIQLFEH